ncbi:MAG: VacJ family lipoprotein [Chromatiales bacterium]
MNNKKCKLLMLALGFFTAGCASTPTVDDGNNDPLESVNRVVYEFNDGLDRYLIRPVAQKYADYTPEPVREGITNFFGNLTYLNVILNAFLQGKFNQGFSDVGRFALNSTMGFGGFFDPATAWGVPKHDEDFGQTLGVWGMDEVAYIVLPLLGPSSVRDAPDLATSALLNPLFYVSSIVIGPIGALGIVNTRANLLEATRVRDEAALDPYTFTREAFRQRRINAIHNGDPPVENLDEFIEGDGTEEGVLLIK